jgi:hypothetical protein
MSATHRSTKRSLRTLTLISGLLFAALGAGLYYWSATCPCYLSGSVCDAKYWASHVEKDEQSRLRIDGKVYPVTLNRVMEESRLDRAWRARVLKLQTFGEPPYNPAPATDAQRPERWWSFAVTSRT